MRKSSKSEGRAFWKLSKWNWSRPSSKILLLTVPGWYFFGGAFVLFLYWACHALASAHCCPVVTCWERAELLALVCGVKLCGCYFSIWYTRSDVVLDCINCWSLPTLTGCSFLFSFFFFLFSGGGGGLILLFSSCLIFFIFYLSFVIFYPFNMLGVTTYSGGGGLNS